METADAIGSEAVVFHVGSHLGLGFDEAVALVEPALRELLELTTDDLWLCMENAAGAGGTIGRSISELAALSPTVDRHPRLGLCLDSCHWWASGVDVSDPDALDDALDDLDAQIGLDRLRVLHVNDSQTPLGSNRDRHELVGRGLIGDGLATFLGHPAFAGLPAITETWEDRAKRPRISIACARSVAAAGGAGPAGARRSRDGREDAERRALAGQLVELGDAAPEIVLAVRIRADDLDLAHGQRSAACAHGAEAATPGLGLFEQLEIDLDVVDLLHAPDVRVAPRLVRVDERAGHPEARSRVDDLLAVDVAVAARHLVLDPERELDPLPASSTSRLCSSRVVRPQVLTRAGFQAVATASARGCSGRVGRVLRTWCARSSSRRSHSLRSRSHSTTSPHPPETVEFVLAALSLIPLAWLIGEATDHAAEHTGPGIGGFLNATFGNAPELIIALIAVNDGLDRGRPRLPHRKRRLQPPARARRVARGGRPGQLDRFSSFLSFGLIAFATVLFLVPVGPRAGAAIPTGTRSRRRRGDLRRAPRRLRRGHLVLAAPTRDPACRVRRRDRWLVVARRPRRSRSRHGRDRSIAEILVGSLEVFSEKVGLCDFFVAAVIVAIVGNAAEHGGAVVVAHRGKIALAAEIALASAAQVAVFLIPAVVLLSWLIDPLSLSFRPVEIGALAGSVVFAALVLSDGRSSRRRGALLLLGYGVVVVAFFVAGER